MIERIAHAKINLALHVTGQREDGYHLLDSLVAFTQLGDRIYVRENSGATNLVDLRITGPFAGDIEAGANNLVSRAALALAYKLAEAQLRPAPVEIHLEKNLPVASGIGGGSADAAATLLALSEVWNTDTPLEGIAAKLGADIPMCLHSKPLRAQGIGDDITLLECQFPLHVVLVNPGIQISTPEVFKTLFSKENSVINGSVLNKLPTVHDLKTMRNDLQVPAIEIEPEIMKVMDALEETKSLLARMSGSGATCFGIYENAGEAANAVSRIQEQRSDWWCVATSTTLS